MATVFILYDKNVQTANNILFCDVFSSMESLNRYLEVMEVHCPSTYLSSNYKIEEKELK